ncbi:MAG: MFS transporter [Bacteroidales bacterium]|nr:MFS transporter [Bacteroidales bacterium]
MNEVKKKLKDSAALRWMVLILISGLTFGTYWFQDFYSGLKPLMESQLHFSSSDFGLLISSTTWINLIGGIIVGGIILDKWGIRITGIVFGSLATMGAITNYIGASGMISSDPDTQLSIMMAGRVMFGIGLEVACVVAMRTIVKWFKGYELALAMAINMGFGRLGSALGTALSIDIAAGDVSPAIAFAGTLIAVGLLLFIIYIVMFDIKLDRQLAAETVEGGADESFKFSDLIKLLKNRSFILIALLCVAFYSAVFPFMQYAPDLLINKFGFTAELPANIKMFTLFGSVKIGNVAIFIGLFIFSLSFSLIPTNIKNRNGKFLSIGIIFVLFFLFMTSIWPTFSVWLENGPKTASLIPLGTILFTPIFGTIVDKKGKAASLMILGALLLIFAHLALSVFDSKILGYFGLLSLGIAFSLVPASMWPSVAKIVAENRLGTAFATMFTIQNYGLALFFWLIGKVLDMANKSNLEAIRAGEMPYDYTIPILMLVILGVISIFLAFLLRKADKEQGYGLELPSNATSE